MDEINWSDYFSPFLLISWFLWLVLLGLIIGFIRARNQNKETFKLFIPSFSAKIAAALLFCAIYLLYYQGGDTVAYWEGAQTLHRLFEYDIWLWLQEMIKTPEMSRMGEFFNFYTGYPPGWIYREPESFFVSKFTFFLSIITFKSYLASSMIMAFLLTLSSWFFYRTILLLNLHSWRLAGLISLFIPTVLFWCGGISKDSIVLIAILLFVACSIRLFLLKEPHFTLWLGWFVAIFIIFQIRLYVLVAFAPSILMAYSAYLSRKNSESSFKRRSIQVGFFLMSLSILLVYYFAAGGAESVQKVFDEIIITQQDFANNPIYGTNKYDLGLSGFSIPDILRATPMAIITALYRPFPWEVNNILLLFNGLENVLLLYLTWRFVRNGFINKCQRILSNEFLIFSLMFILIMGFSIGFTSGLFGVLVRFKSIILPFFLLLLTVQPKEKSVNHNFSK